MIPDTRFNFHFKRKIIISPCFSSLSSHCITYITSFAGFQDYDPFPAAFLRSGNYQWFFPQFLAAAFFLLHILPACVTHSALVK